jgi:Cyclin
MARIRKTLYYGPSLKCPNRISRPMAELSAEFFSETHKNHSLNRLNYTSLGKYNNVTPCPLLIALIYLDRLNNTDPSFARRITPSELFLVSLMVSTKFYCGHDEELYISDWAEYGNISAERMMEIELEFLSAMVSKGFWVNVF